MYSYMNASKLTNHEEAKDEVKRTPRKYRRRLKTNKSKPLVEPNEPKTTKPINLVTFTFD
jgi:hypothetical protein